MSGGIETEGLNIISEKGEGGEMQQKREGNHFEFTLLIPPRVFKKNTFAHPMKTIAFRITNVNYSTNSLQSPCSLSFSDHPLIF